MSIDKHERVHKICQWAKERYTIPGYLEKKPDGTYRMIRRKLVLTVGGEPTRYSRIVVAAIDKYLHGKGAQYGIL